MMGRLKTHGSNVVPQRETQRLLEMIGVNKRGWSAWKQGYEIRSRQAMHRWEIQLLRTRHAEDGSNVLEGCFQ